MIAQTAAVLDEYERRGGAVTRLVLPGVGHSPHVEAPEEVAAALVAHLG